MLHCAERIVSRFEASLTVALREGVLVALLARRDAAHLPVWRSNLALWSHAAAVQPDQTPQRQEIAPHRIAVSFVRCRQNIDAGHWVTRQESWTEGGRKMFSASTRACRALPDDASAGTALKHTSLRVAPAVSRTGSPR